MGVGCWDTLRMGMGYLCSLGQELTPLSFGSAWPGSCRLCVGLGPQPRSALCFPVAPGNGMGGVATACSVCQHPGCPHPLRIPTKSHYIPLHACSILPISSRHPFNTPHTASFLHPPQMTLSTPTSLIPQVGTHHHRGRAHPCPALPTSVPAVQHRRPRSAHCTQRGSAQHWGCSTPSPPNPTPIPAPSPPAVQCQAQRAAA